ncbi:MAG: hypothetical protein RBS22_04255 [Spongiibacteraceae bacterium]|nr:hypothetical protein [Spongiibacteraceae bacterium]
MIEQRESIPASGIGQLARANLCLLEGALREQWHLGQQIALCWCQVPEGIDVLMVPHYYLANFTASLNDCSPTDRLDALNGKFIRQLIGGERQMSIEDFRGTARRLELPPCRIELPIPLRGEAVAAAEALVRRFSISYVPKRAVLLFDIVDFSLYTPFEQTSQLNSLSYSLNAACSKLLRKNIAVDFARTTTGDGFYVWHRSTSPTSHVELFQFMLLTLADNAIARRKARGNTAPLLRTGFHIGSHYEFNQVEGLNPTLSSYIVGDVTIELARMLDKARPGQIFLGEFAATMPTSSSDAAYLVDVDSPRFVERLGKHLEGLRGLEIAGERVIAMHCYLSGESGSSAGSLARRYRITDKHGRSRDAYNLRINIHTREGRPLILGVQEGLGPEPVTDRRSPHTGSQARAASSAAKPLWSPLSARRARRVGGE